MYIRTRFYRHRKWERQPPGAGLVMPETKNIIACGFDFTHIVVVAAGVANSRRGRLVPLPYSSNSSSSSLACILKAVFKVLAARAK